MRKRSETGRASERRGRRAEWLAAALLLLKGYRLLGRRVKTRAGEIDLIAKSPGGVLCFVEVKARPDQSEAATAVHRQQRQRIARAAALYCRDRPGPMRFDIVTIIPGHWPRHWPDAWRPDDLD